MDYTLKTARKYAAVAIRLTIMAGFRKVGFRNAAVDEYDDQTVLRAVELAWAFEPAETVRQPAGWTCQHMAITSNHSLGRPSPWCGCDMTPVINGTYAA